MIRVEHDDQVEAILEHDLLAVQNLYYSLIVYLLLTLAVCLEVFYFVVVCSLHYEI
jgi:hypothetical protein